MDTRVGEAGRQNRFSPIPAMVMAAGLVLLAACAPANPPVNGSAARSGQRPTATADVAAFVVYPQTPAASPAVTPTAAVDSALLATLDDYAVAVGDDPTGAKAAAAVTLRNFVDPAGPYQGAWWFVDDQHAGLDEILAVIFYGEGSTDLDVRKAIAARYLWYCGGEGRACHGHALIDFLAYFQAWREPWQVRGGFSNGAARDYLALAGDVVEQRGLVTEWIPGAAWFVHTADALSAPGPIDWEATPFHFANADPSWDAYLRQALRRDANGPNRLWVLTVGEAGLVCGSGFVCPDLTQARP
jgi:hypothetical protein